MLCLFIAQNNNQMSLHTIQGHKFGQLQLTSTIGPFFGIHSRRQPAFITVTFTHHNSAGKLSSEAYNKVRQLIYLNHTTNCDPPTLLSWHHPPHNDVNYDHLTKTLNCNSRHWRLGRPRTMKGRRKISDEGRMQQWRS